MSEINKYFSQNPQFVETLNSIGFLKGPSGVWFYRNRKSYLDVIAFWPSSSGKHLDVPVVCFKTELIDHCDMSDFPKGFIKNMSNVTNTCLSKRFSDVSRTQSPWKIETGDDLETTLDTLSTAVVEKVDTWFKSIENDQIYFDVFSEDSRENGYGARIRDKLDIK